MPAKILIADDERHVAEGLQMLLADDGYEVDMATDGQAAWELIEDGGYALVLADLRMPEVDGLELFSRMREAGIASEMIIITGKGSVDTAKEAMREGAYDYLEKPLKIDRLKELIPKAIEKYEVREANRALEERLANMRRFGDLIGQSEEMRSIYTTIEAAAPSNASMLIIGESGTGKELVARLIHLSGARADGPFVAVNCGAIPAELLESEFFGHKRGSFTGANADKIGLFQAAHGGTLMLDEVADLPLPMQVKLLRAIQEKAIRPIGAQAEQPVDVRLISATHKNLHELVDRGHFRQDLYYRINVIELPMPPLRERREDIPKLAAHILAKLDHEGRVRLTEDAGTALLDYPFPGNIRELENILERAMALCDGNAIGVDDLQLPVLRPTPAFVEPAAERVVMMPPVPGGYAHDPALGAGYGSGGGAFAPGMPVPGAAGVAAEAAAEPVASRDAPLEDYIEQLERDRILKALEANRYNKTKTAQALGITFRALRYRLKKLGIE